MIRDFAVWLYMRIASMFMVLFAALLGAIGLAQFASDMQLMQSGIKLPGIVVEMREQPKEAQPSPSAKVETVDTAGTKTAKSEASSPEPAKTCAPKVAPVVRYTDPSGTTRTHVSTTYSCPAAHGLNTTVTMLVDPSRPDHARIEAELQSALVMPAMMGGIALVIALVAWWMLPGRQTLEKLLEDPPLAEHKDLVTLADTPTVTNPLAAAGASDMPRPASPLHGIVASAELIADEKIPLDLCEFCAYLAALAYEEIRTDGGDGKTTVKVLDYLKNFPSDSGKSPFEDVVVFARDTTEGFGFVLDGARFIILRGTMGWGDWMGNLDAKRTGRSEFLPPGLTEAPLRHHGFAKAWDVIGADVRTWLDRDPRGKAAPIIISGHSLGGALSFLGAWALASEGRNVRAVITFGAALPGGSEFKDSYAKLGLDDRTLRLEFTRDIVPMAQKLLMYESVGHGWEPKQLPFISLRIALISIPIVWLADSLGQGLLPTTKKKGDAPPPPRSTSQTIRTWLRRFVLFAAFSGILALRAHQMQKRYALALSIMSYRKIRARRLAASGAATLSQAELAAAYEDLRRHLRAIRGSTPEAPAPFDTIPGLPRVVGSPDELRWFKAFFPARSW
jgi:hypothetical protein